MHEKYEITERLIDILLSSPFPYNDVLRLQIASAKVTIETMSYYYKILFAESKATLHLPDWLEKECYCWEYATDGAPIWCHVYVDNGFIEELYVVDMGFEEIKWDYVWNGTPRSHYEYDMSVVVDKACEKPITLTKQMTWDENLAIEISDEEERRFVLHFQNCKMENDISVPVSCKLSISRVEDNKYPVRVAIDEAVVLQCEAVYLDYFESLG